jgi:hypothetical protein
MSADGAARPAPAVASANATRVDVERLVVHARGDASAGQRIAERLPAALSRRLAAGAADDAGGVRRLVEAAVREAAR